MYNQNNKGAKKVLIAYIISFAVMGLLICSLIINNREVVREKKQKEQQEAIEEKVNKDKQDNVSILTEDMKEELNEKLGMILGDKEFIKNSKTTTSNFNYYILKRNLTSEDKQLIALENTPFNDLTENENSIEDVKTYLATNPTAVLKQQTRKEVNKVYEQLFGEELSDIEEENGKCSKYKYYKDKDLFISVPAICDEDITSYFLGYVYDYKRKGDTVTLLLSIGYKTNNTIYADFDLNTGNTIIARNTIEDEETIALSNNIINENNYKKFSRYNVSFTKLEDGGFSFTNIKQID